MHSFIGIAETGETTLAVVAPGIAEALAATAMGLVAAIPAVIAFNKVNSTIRKINKEALAAISLVGNALARLRFSRLGQDTAQAA
jgi:biopolymer transport protein ExbB/TolQ